jgi:hypothetical protein
MNKKKYLAFDAIRFSFKMLRKHFYFFFKLFSVASLLFCVIALLVCYIKQGLITQDDFKAITTTLNYFTTRRALEITKQLKELELTRFIVLFIPLFASIYLVICDMIGSVLSIRLYDDKYISFKETVSHFRKIPSYFGVAVLYSLVTSAGYSLFIIPGLLMEIRLRFCKYFIVDKNIGIIQSLKGSWHISKAHMFDIFMVSIMGQSIVMIGTMMSNGLCELIAIDIISIAIICYTTFTCLFINVCAHAFFYRKLLEEKQKQLEIVSIIDENHNWQSQERNATLDGF